MRHALCLIVLAASACAAAPTFADFETAVGLSPRQVEKEVGPPHSTERIEKIEGQFWFGPIEDILNRVEVGTVVTTWYYPVKEGRAHVFFTGDSSVVRWVRLEPEGVVY